MDHHELKTKLHQIEEQAHLTLSEFPKTLTKERQRMIIAIARYVRTELETPRAAGVPEPLDSDPDRTIEIEKTRH
jgi:hypothetical protein